MKTNKSALHLIDHKIILSYFQSIINKEAIEETIDDAIAEQDIDIDFNIKIHDENNQQFIINLFLSSQPEEREGTKNSGYQYKLHLAGEFYLDQSFEEPKKGQYILYSALPMLINTARNHLQTVSMNAFYGPYNLPAIDLPDLVQKWQQKDNPT